MDVSLMRDAAWRAGGREGSRMCREKLSFIIKALSYPVGCGFISNLQFFIDNQEVPDLRLCCVQAALHMVGEKQRKTKCNQPGLKMSCGRLTF